MVGVVGSLIVLGGLAVLIFLAVRPRPDTPPPLRPPVAHSAADDTLARRVRRLEDELDDLSAQLGQLRDDVQYLLRQIEDRN